MRRSAKITLSLLTLLLVAFQIPAGIPPVTTATSPSQILWQRTWGSSGNDFGVNIATDSAGNIYVAGIYNYTFTGAKILLLKYDSNGNLLWQRTWGGAKTSFGWGIVVDPSGSIYVSGFTNSTGGGGGKAVLLKFNSTGGLVWQRTWGSSGSEVGFGLALDSSGNIYMTGSTTSFGGTIGDCQIFIVSCGDLILLEFSPNGTLLQQVTWGGSGIDYGVGVAVDSSGNIYLSGYTNSTGAGGGDALLLKLNPTFGVIWQRTWGGIKYDRGIGVALDPSGSVYLVGETKSYGAGDSDELILKLSASGTLIWQRTWGGASSDIAVNAIVDSAGLLHVIGLTGSSGAGLTDFSLLTITSTGSLQSQLTWGGNNTDEGLALTLDSAGNTIATGWVSEPPPYLLSANGNSTLGTPSFTLGTPGFSTVSRSLSSGMPALSVQIPTGTTSYAGGGDVALFKYGPATVGCGSQCSVTVQSNSTVSNITYTPNTNSLSFTATGAKGSKGFVNITINKSTVHDITKLKVYANSTQIPPANLTITSNVTDYFVYFILTFHSSYNVDITFGVSIVPLNPYDLTVVALTLTIIAAIGRASSRRSRHHRMPLSEGN